MLIGGHQHPPAPLPQESPVTLGAQVWVGFGIGLDGCQNISTAPAIEPHNIQPIASCYTNCAVPAVVRKATILDQSVYFIVLIKNY
jgi:hypothetical protein